MVWKQNNGHDFKRVIVLNFEDCFSKAFSSEVGRQNRPPTMNNTCEEISSSRHKVASIVGHASVPETVGCDKFAPANAGKPVVASIIEGGLTARQTNVHASLLYVRARPWCACSRYRSFVTPYAMPTSQVYTYYPFANCLSTVCRIPPLR